MVREDIVERTLRWMTENLMGKEWKEWGQIFILDFVRNSRRN